MILSELEKALAGAGLFAAGESRVLVACSGGLDSVVLAHAAAAFLGARRVVLGHVDHALRESSRQDAEHVRRLAAELGVGCEVVVLSPERSDEATLRDLRYRALFTLGQRYQAERILVAHHREDQAETVLLQLLRSTRLASLCGMPAERAPLLRPFLGVPRAEIRAYAKKQRLDHVEDPTNLEPKGLRSRLRKELLPLLESRYRSGFAERLVGLAAEVRALHVGAPPIADPERQGSPRAADPGSTPQQPAGIRIERRPWTGGPVPANPSQAYFDAAALPRLVVRPVQPEDRIRPFGMVGHKKLKDVLVDAKVPRERRPHHFVVADADSGEIVYLSGLLRSAAAPVGPATEEVWVLTCEVPPNGPS